MTNIHYKNEKRKTMRNQAAEPPKTLISITEQREHVMNEVENVLQNENLYYYEKIDKLISINCRL